MTLQIEHKMIRDKCTNRVKRKNCTWSNWLKYDVITWNKQQFKRDVK